MSFVSPVKGYATSEYGYRGGTLHAGLDIGTGGVAAPVYASRSGRLSNIIRSRKRGQSAKVGNTVAGGRSGNGGRIKHSGGQDVFIHVRFIDGLHNGDKVTAGQLLGYVDLSGNTSGYHLHFETWSTTGKTLNPRLAFSRAKLAVGSTPKKASAPVVKPKPSGGSGYPTIGPENTKKLKGMGLPATPSGVKTYQRENGLFVDGRWGPITEKHYQWVKRLQAYLNTWLAVQRRYGRIAEDGRRGPVTQAAERLARNAATNRTPFRLPAGKP